MECEMLKTKTFVSSRVENRKGFGDIVKIKKNTVVLRQAQHDSGLLILLKVLLNP